MTTSPSMPDGGPHQLVDICLWTALWNTQSLLNYPEGAPGCPAEMPLHTDEFFLWLVYRKKPGGTQGILPPTGQRTT